MNSSQTNKTTLGNYMSMIKFSHTVFALPFAFIGFFLAVAFNQHPFSWLKLILMVLCMVFARSAAMAFNRWLDRKFDAANPRTASREVPAGVISPQNALLFTIVNCILFVATTFFINDICFYLSPIALAVILFYSYTKRFTSLCHLVLGLGLALAPIGAYLVVTGVFNLLPVLFSFVVLTWVSGFDIIYALQDASFDKSQGLHSIPAALGNKGALLFSAFLHLLTIILIIAIGFVAINHWVYWTGVLFFTSLLIYQHLIVKPNDLSKVNIAFINTNSMASIIFAITTIISLYLF